jgi:hypothetical protein
MPDHHADATTMPIRRLAKASQELTICGLLSVLREPNSAGSLYDLTPRRSSPHVFASDASVCSWLFDIKRIERRAGFGGLFGLDLRAVIFFFFTLEFVYCEVRLS